MVDIYHIHQVAARIAVLGFGLCSVLRPLQHSIGYIGDGFYRSKDPTNSIKSPGAALGTPILEEGEVMGSVMVSFNRAMVVSYRHSIVTITLSLTIQSQFAIDCLRRKLLNTWYSQCQLQSIASICSIQQQK